MIATPAEERIAAALREHKACCSLREIRAVAALLAAEREACAEIAASYEAPYYVEHPGEKFVEDLRHVIVQAALNYDRDDDEQPERNIAEAVANFILTGNHARPKNGLGAEPCASAAIRARSA